jgi:hypothetical protein
MRDQRTRLILAEIRGEVMRHARWEPLSDEEMAAAVAAVRGILAGRDDGPQLLAEVAGITTGARAGWPDELARAVVAASVCVQAGADEWLIDGWAEVGAERRAQADQPPFGLKVLGRLKIGSEGEAAREAVSPKLWPRGTSRT